MAGKETWKNATDGYIVLAKIDRRGDVGHEIVPSGKTVAISVDERLMNQDSAANEDLNIFRNGMMVPVRLLEGTEDKAEIESNPNLKSEEDLRKMFGLQWKKFEIEVGEINNVTTLNRLKSIAQEGDATVRQVNVIEARIAEVDPSVAVNDVTMEAYGSMKEARPQKSVLR